MHINKHIILEEFSKKYADIILLIYFIDNCNYNCIYCYNHRPYTKQLINVDLLFRFIQFLSENNTKKIAIEIIGGEPTLHPKLTTFIEKIKTLNVVDICIFTNLSLNISFYTQLIDKYDVRFLATWHSTKQNNRNQSFITKILTLDKKYFLKNNQCGFNAFFIRIMLEYDMFDFCVALYKKIVKLYPNNVDISLVADPTKSSDKNNIDENNTNYSKLQKQTYKYLCSLCNVNKKTYKVIFDDNSIQYLSFQDMFLYKLFSYYMYKCNAGLDYFYIHSDGNVFPCQSYYEINATPIYNINQKTQFIKNKFTICKSKICSCDFGIKKERIFS